MLIPLPLHKIIYRTHEVVLGILFPELLRGTLVVGGTQNSVVEEVLDLLSSLPVYLGLCPHLIQLYSLDCKLGFKVITTIIINYTPLTTIIMFQ